MKIKISLFCKLQKFKKINPTIYYIIVSLTFIQYVIIVSVAYYDLEFGNNTINHHI